MTHEHYCEECVPNEHVHIFYTGIDAGIRIKKREIRETLGV